MLLERRKADVVEAVRALGGLQAQLARPPYLALWARIEGFRREDLTGPVMDRALVRGTLMRGTLHLVGAGEYATFRPLLQPMLSKSVRSVLRERAEALDIEGLVAAAKAYLAGGGRTFEEIRDHLESLKLPGDERARGFAVRMSLPLIQVPDGSAWGYPGDSPFALAEEWLSGRAAGEGTKKKGAPEKGAAKKGGAKKGVANEGTSEKGAPEGAAMSSEEREDALVLHHLAAFGPATVVDAQSWSGVTPLKAAFERLRERLVVFRDDKGKELFDLPDAPRPDESVPAPVRFLPEFDSLGLGHDNRDRLVDEAHRKLLFRPNLLNPPMFLVDGRAAGTWKIDAKKKAAILEWTPFGKLSKKVLGELAEEGERLLRFVEPAAKAYEVREAGKGRGA